MANLPPWGTVTKIEPSRTPGTAYVTIDLHQNNDRHSYVYRTNDYGRTWTSIADIPLSQYSYAHCILEDPVRKGLLYLGTENALYASFDDGAHWISLQSNLPHAPVEWLTVQEQFNDLVVATYGRGFWILDDITPLQQLDDTVRSSVVHLFPPRQAYRFLTRPVLPMYMGEHNDPPTALGHNPPYAAPTNYYLRAAVGSDVEIGIADPGGRTITTIKGTKQPGINRVWWDLKYESTKRPLLRTSPVGHPEIALRADLSRPFPLEGSLTPLVAPGTYTVKLKAGAATASRPLVVRKDPNSQGTDDGIHAQTTLVMDIWRDVNAIADIIERIEMLRRQIADIKASLQADARWKAQETLADELDRKLLAIEWVFFDPRITSAGDSFYYPPGLYSKLLGVARGIMESDYQPTAAQRDVASMFMMTVSGQKEKLDAVIREDVGAFNDGLTAARIPHVAVTVKPTPQ